MTPVALGFRTHTGWAVVVAVALRPNTPLVVHRGDFVMREGSALFEPYHVAARLARAEGETLIQRTRELALKMAGERIGALVEEMRSSDYRAVAAGVALSRTPPPTGLEQALASHPGGHNAEGWLYREAVMRAAEDCGLRVVAGREVDLPTLASAVLGTSEGRLLEQVAELGAGLGPPWGKDQRVAALAALFALKPAP